MSGYAAGRVRKLMLSFCGVKQIERAFWTIVIAMLVLFAGAYLLQTVF